MTYNAETKVWSGPKVTRNIENFLFREIIWKNLNSNPQKVFQISDDEGTELTYSETKMHSVRVAQNLQILGIGCGDVVATVFNNSTFLAPIVFGCNLIGAPVYTFVFRIGLNVDWIKQTFEAMKPNILILEEYIESAGLISDVLSEMNLDCKIFLVKNQEEIEDSRFQSYNEILKKTGRENDFVLPVDGMTDYSPVFILPSSGTTGPPKVIAMPGRQCKFMKYVWNFREDGVTFGYSTITWFSGLVMLLYPILTCGTRIITKHKFCPKNYGDIAKKYGVTVTITSTENSIAIYKSTDFNADDFESIDEFFCGGERVPRSIRNYLSAQLKKKSFTTAYGSTEIGVVSKFQTEIDLSAVKDNIVGKLRPNSQCKVVDIETRKALGHREVGEILSKPEAFFTEYYGMPQKTKEAFEDGWYKTGDVGYVDEEGYIYVFGRVGDMLTCDGFKIHPAEIESLIESFDGVAAACAVNVSEDIVAVLVIKLPGSNTTEDLLTDTANESLRNIKIKGGIYIVDEIPRTQSVSCKIFRPDAQLLAIKLMNDNKLVS